MGLPYDHPCLRLSLLPAPFFVRKVQAVTPDLLLKLSSDSESQEVFSITRTPEEVSVVGQCASDGDPEAKWRCFKIAGPMEFELTGVVCAFTTPLKDAGIPVFAVSTWNTDYVLVPKEKVSDAVEALEGHGWLFDDSVSHLHRKQR
ncbi:hypothetical protein L226DRAFT_157973 [Lentinus tigrinus ALCF2SS1-7]|uniref:CASTOR ACT domain-containing protein n=1 Tax=Lentinus tigrinus ALCF2SS1-6 TaxID=1328759 RepID=A0A5C2S509_9APHY|nr:hypothetical protein L227DRAFT_505690 [Lentinus tigrinus ALCF2SS1-6]RPD72265.1 hypothetical protein L226DRAFT_157973 [Lentinus tigrinus ALCF2SS1-7]